MSDESQKAVVPEVPVPEVLVPAPVEVPPVPSAVEVPPVPSSVEVPPVPSAVEAPPVPSAVERPELKPQPYWNSYVAGVALGLVLLSAFVFTGRGLGASGAVTRMAAYTIQKAEASLHGGTSAEAGTIARHNAYTGQYLKGPGDPLDDFLVYMFVGVIVGGFISGMLARRSSFEVVHGPHSTTARRLFFAALGGFVSAYGARLARGCTSGQALTGGATLALGSWVFMLAVFAGGYGIAYFVRKEWT
jgi:hypothetical protein